MAEAKLPEIGVQKGLRIWWRPTAELCMLPIHVAGPYEAGGNGLLDLYIQSYTSTLLTSTTPVLDINNPSALSIAPSGSTLLIVQEENLRIRKFEEFTTLLEAAVKSSVEDHQWVHFAGYGHRNPESFHSSFEHHAGERLELLDLMKTGVQNAELVFLSACHSATVDRKVLDEPINISEITKSPDFQVLISAPEFLEFRTKGAGSLLIFSKRVTEPKS